jgi:hypothetical protein
VGFDLSSILKTLTMVGTELPAYKALFDSVKSAFGEHDQAKLQEAYAAAMADNDAGHARLQALLAEAAKH